MNEMKRVTTSALVLGMLALAGCSITEQTRSVKHSGFLGTYGDLQQGGEGDPHLIYVNSRTQWSNYTKVLMEPIRIYADRGSKLATLPSSDLQSLVDNLDASVRTELGEDYTFVTVPGPGVLRLRIAITEASGSVVALDTMSNIMPPLVAANALKRAATGTHLAVGQTGVEAEILDAQSGKRLAAMVDERAGGKTFAGKFGKWNDTQAAFKHWATGLKTRLAMLRE